jgi:hypothetical protein
VRARLTRAAFHADDAWCRNLTSSTVEGRAFYAPRPNQRPSTAGVKPRSSDFAFALGVLRGTTATGAVVPGAQRRRQSLPRRLTTTNLPRGSTSNPVRPTPLTSRDGIHYCRCADDDWCPTVVLVTLVRRWKSRAELGKLLQGRPDFRVHFSRSQVAASLWDYGEDDLAGRSLAMSDADLASIQAIASWYEGPGLPVAHRGAAHHSQPRHRAGGDHLL